MLDNAMESFVLTTEEATSDSAIGGKARALLSLRRAGFSIPDWAVVIPEAWTAWSASAQRESVEKRLLDDLLRALPQVEQYAVRSSAGDEDGAEHSFAGQLESYLFVPRANLIEKIRAVCASGLIARIWA